MIHKKIAFACLILLGLGGMSFAETVYDDAACGPNKDLRCIIFLSRDEYNGSMLRPDVEDWSGTTKTYIEKADEQCMREVESYLVVPDEYKNVKFKALLTLRNSTIRDVNYYRKDQVTLIAKAEGGNLAKSLQNTIHETTDYNFWTGFYNTGYDETKTEENCNQFTLLTYSSPYGYKDRHGGIASSFSVTDWAHVAQVSCYDVHRIACVAQPN